MATEYAAAIRVNALAPGFFLTDQNRFLLTDKSTGGLTDRGQHDRRPHAHGPLRESRRTWSGAALWLLSPLARFVTGVVLPVDGGFAAFSGV